VDGKHEKYKDEYKIVDSIAIEEKVVGYDQNEELSIDDSSSLSNNSQIFEVIKVGDQDVYYPQEMLDRRCSITKMVSGGVKDY